MMARRRRAGQGSYGIKPAERWLIDRLPELRGEVLGCMSLGRAQLADHLARTYPEAQVTCLYLDQYQARRAYAAQNAPPANLRIVCDTDFPEEEHDAIVIPLPAKGERELARDLMQDAYQRLRDGGVLVVGNDRPQNMWLHDEMRKLFDKVTQIEFRGATLLSGVRKGPLKKERDFSCEFAFRDQERLIKAISRPGVFSHRHLDLGARALINAMEIAAGDRVLDLGCGSGVVSFAAAFRAEQGNVTAVDSNARAVQCTQIGAELNGLTNVEALLDDELTAPESFAYDVALANPPYYSNYRIAELFLEGAHRALRKQGRVYVVARKAGWFLKAMPQMFRNVELVAQGQFEVVRGIQP